MSTCRRALLDDAVGRDLFARAHDEALARRASCSTGIAALASQLVQNRDVLGAELQQCLQRGAGAALSARLEVAAEQDERRHDGSDLEVDLVAAGAALGTSSNGMRMPGMPAPPRNRA